MRFNRHLLYNRIYYNCFCNFPSYHLNDEGAQILRDSGWHPVKNPFVDDDVEDILLQRYLLKKICKVTWDKDSFNGIIEYL